MLGRLQQAHARARAGGCKFRPVHGQWQCGWTQLQVPQTLLQHAVLPRTIASTSLLRQQSRVVQGSPFLSASCRTLDMLRGKRSVLACAGT